MNLRPCSLGAYDEPLARALWADTGLDAAVAAAVGSIAGKKAAGLNASLRIYSYAVGEVFGPHYDESTDIRTGRTELTLLCYLTGGGEGADGANRGAEYDDEERMLGGETAFYRDSNGARELFRVAPVAGTVLVFRHGSECLPHASLAVRRGRKVVLRSDVVFASR